MTKINNGFRLNNNSFLNNLIEVIENMANILPTDLLPGYQLLAATDPAPSQGIFVPLSTFPSLTAGEANATTGDGREVARGIIKTMQTSFQSLTNKPAEMNITRGTDQVQGIDTYRQNFTAYFDVVADTNTVTMSPEA